MEDTTIYISRNMKNWLLIFRWLVINNRMNTVAKSKIKLRHFMNSDNFAVAKEKVYYENLKTIQIHEQYHTRKYPFSKDLIEQFKAYIFSYLGNEDLVRKITDFVGDFYYLICRPPPGILILYRYVESKFDTIDDIKCMKECYIESRYVTYYKARQYVSEMPYVICRLRLYKDHLCEPYPIFAARQRYERKIEKYRNIIRESNKIINNNILAIYMGKKIKHYPITLSRQ
jgi:hypothetical protein